MKILLIEDEHKIARLVKKSLEQEGYSIDVSYDGDDGHKMATTKAYDAVVVDRTVPGSYDGIELIKSMRENGVHSPVLFLSDAGGKKDKTEGLDAGADDYLSKPFAVGQLLTRLRALLGQSADSQQLTNLGASDLTMDTLTYEVKRGDTNIHLTSKEFSLLEFLLRNPGRPLSKDDIINYVWDYEADVLPNTVEVYIKYLRNKVDAPFKTSLIKTIRGFGYKLDSK